MSPEQAVGERKEGSTWAARVCERYWQRPRVVTDATMT